MSQKQHQLSVDLLESKIRYSGSTNSSDLIVGYIQTVKKLLSLQHQNTDKFQIAERSAFVFFDTIADKKVVKAWRLECIKGLSYFIDLMTKFSYSSCDCHKLKFMKLRFDLMQQSIRHH